MGDFLIRSTAIIAVAGYAGRVLIDAAGLTGARWQRRARVLWTIGGCALLIHAVCAFQFLHHWSHAAAWEYTRQRTVMLTGWDSGIGLGINYGMTAIWLVDILAWWRSLDWPRHRLWYWSVQLLFAFLLFNATAVFGPWYWPPIVGLSVVVAIAMMVIARRNTTRSS